MKRALDAALVFGMLAFLALTPITIAGSEIGLGIAVAAWLARARGRDAAAPRSASAGAPSAGAGERLLGPARPILVPLLLFAAAMTIASLTAFDRAASFAKLQKLLLALALFVFATQACSARRARAAGAALLAGTVATSAYGIWVYLAGEGGLASRLRGISGFYMTTGGIISLALVFLAPGLAAMRRRPWRLALGCGLGVVAWALVLSYSRGAWLGTLAGGAVILALVRPRLLAVAAVAAVALFFAIPGELRDRVTSIADPSHALNRERVHMWGAALRLVKDHPLTGAGLMDMKPLFERYADPDYTGVVHGHFHSNFLQVAASGGLVGLAAFLLLLGAIGTALVRAVRALPPTRAPAGGGRGAEDAALARALAIGGLAAFVSFVVQGFFEWNFGDAEVVTLWYALTGSALAAPSWARLATSAGRVAGRGDGG
jgi:O-antigen ligase